MSFVDLMKSDIWSERDIVNRTEAMINGQFNKDQREILNRKVSGLAIGMYQLSEQEQAELQQYSVICDFARTEGNAARDDMVTLQQILLVEESMRRLALPILPPIEEDGSGESYSAYEQELEEDQAERDIAQATIDTASEEVKGWVLLRNPLPPEPEPLEGDQP